MRLKQAKNNSKCDKKLTTKKGERSKAEKKNRKWKLRTWEKEIGGWGNSEKTEN